MMLILSIVTSIKLTSSSVIEDQRIATFNTNPIRSESISDDADFEREGSGLDPAPVENKETTTTTSTQKPSTTTLKSITTTLEPPKNLWQETERIVKIIILSLIVISGGAVGGVFGYCLNKSLS